MCINQKTKIKHYAPTHHINGQIKKKELANHQRSQKMKNKLCSDTSISQLKIGTILKKRMRKIWRREFRVNYYHYTTYLHPVKLRPFYLQAVRIHPDLEKIFDKLLLSIR